MAVTVGKRTVSLPIGRESQSALSPVTPLPPMATEGLKRNTERYKSQRLRTDDLVRPLKKRSMAVTLTSLAVSWRAQITLLIPPLPLPAIECEVSNWSEWSQCSHSCGVGSQSRTRSILVRSDSIPLPRDIEPFLRFSDPHNTEPESVRSSARADRASKPSVTLTVESRNGQSGRPAVWTAEVG